MRWGAHPVHGVGARGRRSERTQGLSPLLSVIPPRFLLSPNGWIGASPQTRMGQGMDRVVGVDVSKARLDVYDLGRRPAAGGRE